MDWLMEIIANKFNIQELVSWIQKNPELVVKLQKNLTQETCSLFDGKLKVLRMGQGILTPFDALEQNTQIANAIQFICEHNYLYFLELIHRYDLIREIFTEDDQFANELQLIEELERRYTQMQRRQHAWQQANEKAIDQAKHKVDSNPNTLLALNNNYMDLLHYYEHKTVQIHSRYHERQIESHKITTTNYMGVLKDTHDILHKNGHIDGQKKNELNKALDVLEKERLVIDNMPTHNLAAKAEKAARYEAHSLKLNALCKSLHDEHSHVDALHPLRVRRAKIEDTHNKEQKQNREQRDAELAEIKPHLEVAQSKVNESLLKNMDVVINLFNKSNLSQLTDQEQEQFEQAYQQLKDDRARLNNGTSYELLKESHTNFCSNLEKIENLFKSPALSAQQYRELQHEKRMLQSFNFRELEPQVPPRDQASQSSDRSSSPNEHRASNSPQLTAQNTQKYRDQVQEIRFQAKDPEIKKLHTQFSTCVSKLKDALNKQQPASDANMLNENEPASNQATLDEQEPGSGEAIFDDEPNLIHSLIKHLEDLQHLDKIIKITEDTLFSIEDNANALAGANEKFRDLALQITDATMSIMESKEALSAESSDERSYGL